VVESLKTPVAVKRWLPPVGIVTAAGVIKTDVIVTFDTFNEVELVLLPNVAVIVTRPGVMPEAMPLLDPTLAIGGFDELHVT